MVLTMRSTAGSSNLFCSERMKCNRPSLTSHFTKPTGARRVREGVRSPMGSSFSPLALRSFSFTANSCRAGTSFKINICAACCAGRFS
eukprot:Skav216672  [mRNA]  locus=scaffold2477:125742:126005:- [translate_table: standard]